MKRFLATLALGSACIVPTTAAAYDELEWVPWKGRLPYDAVQGGMDQNGTIPLYICRARHINGIHPGKLRQGKCHIAWGGNEVILQRFEVLVSDDRRYRDRDRDWDRDRRYRDDMRR